LREGDLLFFGTNRGTLHATHVAIYIGKGEFIHASGRVMVNSLDSTRSNFDPGRMRTLIAARRLLGTSEIKAQTIAEHPWY
jgi:cell wall-associated NlpC family hydrolase